MKRIWLGLLLIGVQAPTVSGQPGPIRGAVTDSLTGEPVAGARVQMMGAPESTFTDSSGRFTLGAATAIGGCPAAQDIPGLSRRRELPETYAADGSRVPGAELRKARGKRFSGRLPARPSPARDDLFHRKLHR